MHKASIFFHHKRHRQRNVAWASCLILILCSDHAIAQPLFHYENDWTIDIGNYKLGVRDVVQSPGEFRSKQIWMGPIALSTHAATKDTATIVFVPPLAAGHGAWCLLKTGIAAARSR